MTAPRPANMFATAGGSPQETSLAPMRDKLLFIEAMHASDELTGRELRAGTLLASCYSTTTGDAYPSLQFIADALGMDKRHVGRVLDSLEAKGWFTIWRGTRGRGKNHVSRYIPNPEKVPSSAPFRTAANKSAERKKKVPFDSVKGAFSSLKGTSGGTRYVVSLYGHPSDENTAELSSASATALRAASPAGDGATIQQHARADDDDQKPMPKLQKIQTWLKGLTDRPPTASECETSYRWRDLCLEISEERDVADPIGRMAQRLADELQDLLDQYDPPPEAFWSLTKP